MGCVNFLAFSLRPKRKEGRTVVRALLCMKRVVPTRESTQRPLTSTAIRRMWPCSAIRRQDIALAQKLWIDKRESYRIPSRSHLHSKHSQPLRQAKVTSDDPLFGCAIEDGLSGVLAICEVYTFERPKQTTQWLELSSVTVLPGPEPSAIGNYSNYCEAKVCKKTDSLLRCSM